ncbi:hypothetical protein [Tepidanaerobacter syntrophicus]|uniref:hypothetical protein n=1 Tax=Tepidanaerobacter syntrophicus TaxID=224999 RepID=UPI001BD50336|nr:hypothetical protein [Tepidanaerobacter syntrophicus]
MDEWYGNKEIYEMLQGLKADIETLRKDMAETRAIICDYTDLRKKVEDTASKVNMLMWITPIAITGVGVLFTFLNFVSK